MTKEELLYYMHRHSNITCSIGGMLYAYKIRAEKGSKDISVNDMEYLEKRFKDLQENMDSLYKKLKEES